MTQIKLRRDTSAAFASSNPILGNGEPAYETDTKKLKIGDGTTAYTQLKYFSAGGGSSTDISATLPLKIVDGVISIEVDGQTIQVVDGKLAASSTTPTNMVTTDTSQDITGQKSFTTGKTIFKNTDSNRKILGEINSNGAYCNYYIDKASGEKPCYLGKVTRDTFNMGIPDLTGVTGRIFANTLTKWNGSNEVGTILDSSNLGSYVDGTTITYANNKLSATVGGLEVCDIGMALYVDETKGLRRYLNGQILDINTNTQAFLNRLKEITTLHPSLLCTEEEWQTAKTMSAFGQVGKFVFNYSGENIVSVRLPRVVNVQGLFDLQDLGMTVGESLPNIQGRVNGHILSNYATDSDTAVTFTGALEGESFYSGTISGGNNHFRTVTNLSLDASKASSTYQNNAPVQQEAIQYPYFIQIATGSETENNIINDIELNNPYSLFDSKYSDHELNNLSWLKSEGQWNAKTVYPTAYDKLLKVYNGTETVVGLSVKLSTEEYTDYDFVLNTAEETFRLPLLDGSENLIGDKYTSYEIGASGQEYTATHNGYVSVVKSVNKGTVNLYNNTQEHTNTTCFQFYQTVDNAIVKLAIKVNRGDKFIFQYTAPTTNSYSSMILRHNKGNGSLYYYVGETVQNANLIDAGRIGEQLANKVDTSNTQWATNACMPDYSAGINISVPTQSAPYICQYDCYMQGITKKAYYIGFYAYINGTQYILGAGNNYNMIQSNNINLFLPKGTSIYFNNDYVMANSLYVFPLKGVK